MLVFITISLVISACGDNNNSHNKEIVEIDIDKMINSETDTSTETAEQFAVEPPPLTLFPCMECHIELETNSERRALVEMHDDIDAMFNHDSENRWCLDCHYENNRDSLKLASGNRIGFDESYKLCGQCHGDKLRDWKVGVHGKRTGEWNGDKHYLLCVHCHNPHSPRFQALKPLPPPVRQEDINL